MTTKLQRYYIKFYHNPPCATAPSLSHTYKASVPKGSRLEISKDYVERGPPYVADKRQNPSVKEVKLLGWPSKLLLVARLTRDQSI